MGAAFFCLPLFLRSYVFRRFQETPPLDLSITKEEKYVLEMVLRPIEHDNFHAFPLEILFLKDKFGERRLRTVSRLFAKRL